MEDIKYIYRCVCQALALEEAGVVSEATRIANLRYIRSQFKVSDTERAEAERRAAATVQAIRDRR